MDQCVKLTKSIRQNKIDQFSARLAHCYQKLSEAQLTHIVFEILGSSLTHPHLFMQIILMYQVKLKDVYSKKNRFAHFLGKTPLMIACKHSNFQTAAMLLKEKECGLEQSDENGENALFYALGNEREEDSYEIISCILTIDPKLVNKINSVGSSILLAALQNKSLRIIELLLKNQAQPNFQSQSSGNTPLHQALVNVDIKSDKKKDLILLLLNHNADPHIKNKENKTFFDIAKQVNFQINWLNELYKDNEQNKDLLQEQTQKDKVFFQMNSVTKQDDNTIDQNVELSITTSEDSDEPLNMESFNEEIMSFSKDCYKKYEDSWKDIVHVYEKLSEIGNQMNLSIDIIGSYATGLWTQFSDIDIVFTNKETTFIEIEKTLTKIHEHLRYREKELGIKEMYLNTNNIGNTFPNIKMELNSKYHHRKIDITIFQKKNNGQKYVKFIFQKLQEFQSIRPVFFVFQKLLQTFNLHNPAKSGLKTYAIFLMILYIAERMKMSSASELFVSIVYYYAFSYPYEWSLQANDYIEYKMNLFDPLNVYNNVGGRKTDVNKLIEMLKSTYYGIKLASGRNTLPYLFSMNRIFQ